MERLWSPWRLEYVTGSQPKADCIFCVGAIHRSPLQSSQSDLIVFQGKTAYVILNKYPYNNGHLLVVPYRHVSALVALTAEELAEIALLTQRSEAALLETYHPQGFNIGINLGKAAGAGIEEHLHAHIVPRWNGDTNFMTVVGTMRVLPENLGDSAARLRSIFAKSAAPT